VVARIAEAVAKGLTDREAGILAGVRHDTMTEWRKDPGLCIRDYVTGDRPQEVADSDNQLSPFILRS
jgi:hypothetical protein